MKNRTTILKSVKISYLTHLMESVKNSYLTDLSVLQFDSQRFPDRVSGETIDCVEFDAFRDMVIL